jgi:Hemerythrin HHE cation binding domain
MKRNPALTTLSRDHHQALFIAQKLRRTSVDSAPAAVADLDAYWDSHGRAHFRAEEELLFPAYARHADPYEPMLAKLLCDHVAIRQRIGEVRTAAAPDIGALHELGRLLDDHVRLEERELFGLIEAALPPAELIALGTALEQATGG